MIALFTATWSGPLERLLYGKQHERSEALATLAVQPADVADRGSGLLGAAGLPVAQTAEVPQAAAPASGDVVPKGRITYRSKSNGMPSWSQCLIGDDLLQSVDRLGTSLLDLSALSGMTRLQALGLVDGSFSDLSPLAELTQLRELWAQHTSVSDLSPLSGLTQLRVLILRDTPVSDLTPLAGLTQLERLDLDGTSVSDLTPLSQLVRLEQLHLRDTPISHLSPLAKLPELQMLNLLRASVSREHVAEFKEWRRQAGLPGVVINGVRTVVPHRFQEMDKDGDGYLSGGELPAHLKGADVDGDGKVTAPEFDAAGSRPTAAPGSSGS